MPWTKQFSKREQREYYFNTDTGETRWTPPDGSTGLIM